MKERNQEKTYPNELSCDIIRDLLPSYIDRICSEDSKKLIENHILTCPDCAALLDALRESEITRGRMEENQIAYMKKFKYHIGKKELFGLGILFTIIIFSCRAYAEQYGALSSWFYLLLLPLVLFDTHFLLADHITNIKQTAPKIIFSVAGSLLLCCGMLLALLSIQWIKRASYPFSMEAADLGGFLKAIYLFLALCHLAIIIAGVALTLKTSNSYSLAISISITGLFLIFYNLSIFAVLSDFEVLGKTLLQSVYLLLEGACIAVIAEVVQKKRRG
ncbi:MAG: zf-HC2 domain-containing protein [Lachnospiraceae bacterium]|nr:zf-HC2 domain-containing protein [Lachnospiraceae bacterium]